MEDKVLVTFIEPNTYVNEHRLTLKEMLMASAGYTDNKQPYSKNFFRVRTFWAERGRTPQSVINLGLKLESIEYTKAYHSFRIPKMSGGTRLITAPDPELKTLQKEIADTLINQFKILPHDAAYAYTRGRCAYDALVTHQRNNARWFLKIDLKDYFPSVTKPTLQKTLKKIYPLSELTEEQLDILIDIATLNNSLPQGSPLSPILSNLVLVEFDKRLTHKLYRFDKQQYTYTRYADDMLITSPYAFRFEPIVDCIKELFRELQLPLRIANQKLRYASMAGRNWNLGLMYTDDQRITVGSKRKRILHSLVNSFVHEYPWELQPTQELQGKLAYLNNIEPEYYTSLITKYNEKYSVDVEQMLHSILATKV